MTHRLLPVVALAIAASAASAAPAPSIEDLIGQETARELRTEGSLKKVQFKDPAPALAPRIAEGRDVVAAVAAFEPNTLVEALYLFRKPEGASREGWTEAERTAVYNAARSISTLKGTEYYSFSRKKMRLLYEESYLVEGPDGEKPVPDPVAEIPPAASTLYAVQKDLTFGKNRYKYDFAASSGALSFTQENLTGLSMMVFTVVPKGGLRSIVLVVDAGDSLLVYAVSAVKVQAVPGLTERVRESFSNRADAVYGWFARRATEVLSR